VRIPSKLKTAALAEFKSGGDWSRFVDQHGHEIREAERYDAQRYRRLRGRLLHLLTTGDEAGMFPPGDPDALPEWAADDDTPGPHDTETHAKFDARAAGLPLLQGTLFNVAGLYQ